MSSEPGRARGPQLASLGLLFLVALMALHAAASYWQCDDAFISFRYASNWVHGHGLVWNVGERVEGYTNFLWVVELAAFWKLAGVPPERSANFLSGLATIGSVATIWWLARSSSTTKHRTFIVLGTFALLATSRTWSVWTTSGLETRQFTLFVLLGLLLATTARESRGRWAGASLAFAAAALTRPEGLLVWGVVLAWQLAETLFQRPRRIAFGSIVAFAASFLVVVGVHYLWRHQYYGDWLPNTYYAKHVRAWPEAGWRYLASAAIETGAWFQLPLAGLAAFWSARRGDRSPLLYGAVIAAHAGYLVRIGGDHFELRPMDFYWPLLALAATQGMVVTAGMLAARMHTESGRVRMATAATSLLLALGLLYGSVVQTAKSRVADGFASRQESLHMIPRIDRDHSAWLFAIPPMPWLVPIYNDLQAYLLPRGIGVPWREHEILWRAELRKWQPYEVARGRLPLPKDAVAARMIVGISGYYLADLTLVDQLGLNDRYVARQEVTTPNEARVMAHDKVASPDYLAARGVNIRIGPAAPSRAVALQRGTHATQLADGVWMPWTRLGAEAAAASPP